MAHKNDMEGPNPFWAITDFPFVERIGYAIAINARRAVLLEGAGGTGKTAIGKRLASGMVKQFQGNVFWISPELGSFGKQLQGVEAILGSGSGFVVVDSVDEWPNHEEILRAVAAKLRTQQRTARFL